MAKLTIEDLKKIKERVLREDTLRSGEKRIKINVHMGTCGIASGARQILDTLMEELSDSGADDVLITTSGCRGICSKEPLITIEEKDKEPVIYEYLTPNKTRQIFKRHILNGEVQTQFVMATGKEDQ
ncbi:MAG: (2Fe-2S) ferredoxin domain-containing protein [Deltaproteobacteria bacterium]|nr:(2Fe-2S) ferredoxin domain-containing protein [Deltaproteobacteria bacterium]